jgi:hypothetical protein
MMFQATSLLNTVADTANGRRWQHRKYQAIVLALSSIVIDIGCRPNIVVSETCIVHHTLSQTGLTSTIVEIGDESRGVTSLGAQVLSKRADVVSK